MWHLPQNRPLPQGPEDATLLLLSLSCSWHVQLALSKDQPYFLVTHSRAREGSRGGGAGTAQQPSRGAGLAWPHCLFSGPEVAGRQCCCGLLGAPVGSDQAGTCCAYNKPHRSQPLPRASRLQEAGGPPSRPRWALNAFNGQSELTAWAPTSRKMLVLGRTYPTSPLT